MSGGSGGLLGAFMCRAQDGATLGVIEDGETGSVATYFDPTSGMRLSDR